MQLKKTVIAASAMCALALCCGFSIRSRGADGPAFAVTKSPIIARGIDKVEAPVEVAVSGGQVSVKNRSDKPITYLSLLVQFKNKDKDVQTFSALLELGDQKWKKEKDDSVYLKPAQQKTEALMTAKLASFLESIKQKHNVDPSQAEVTLDIVVFSDDTMWRLGFLHRRDPADAKNWLPIRPSKTQIAFNGTALPKTAAQGCDTNFEAGDRFVNCGGGDCWIILPRSVDGWKWVYFGSYMSVCQGDGGYGEICAEYAVITYWSCMV